MIGTILLTCDNQYITNDGKLPDRPDYDKDMLRAMSNGNTVSPAGSKMLPPSIRGLVSMSEVYNFPVTIRELAKADILLVNRSTSTFDGGKVFRLDNFRCIVKEKQIELWIRED